MDAPVKAKRGFAVMDPELVKAIARKGGLAAQRNGTAHQFTHDEAKVAGRKGGIAAHAKHVAKKQATQPQ
jgi:general stress protein YciG